MIKVQGYTDLVRDPKTGAILNTNQESFEKFKTLYRERFEQIEKIKFLENKVKEQEGLIQEILLKLKEIK